MHWSFEVEPRVAHFEVDGAPTEDLKRRFWQAAIPKIAGVAPVAAPTPCVVACRVQVAPAGGRLRGGPLGRAKGLLDALHDDRGAGPYYRDFGRPAPLVDDAPVHVAGLAVEVRPGPAAMTEYRIGNRLAVAGTLSLSVAVDEAAPNDVAGTAGEQVEISRARVEFGRAVRSAFRESRQLPVGATALVVRHRPARDEDNTWGTWIAAVCGVTRASGGHWAEGAPFDGWRPMSVASVADVGLDTPVVYDIWSE